MIDTTEKAREHLLDRHGRRIGFLACVVSAFVTLMLLWLGASKLIAMAFN